MNDPKLSIRRSLHHKAPASIRAGAVFFLTICAFPRGTGVVVEQSKELLSAANYYHEARRWWLRLLVLMPDHVHALASFPIGESMVRCVSDWKRFTSRKTKITWQKNFFDHRIRSDESLDQKADYMRENPVRAGLVARAEAWPWIIENRDISGM